MQPTANPPQDPVGPLFASALDPLFWRASRRGVASAWTMHVPFAHWLVAAARPRCIVELGAHNGVSYAAFCEAVQRSQLDCRCFAVDTWEGDEHAGRYGNEVYADLRQFHDARYAGFSELVRSTFDEALAYVPDQSVDLLHIDGLHTYEAVRHDFEAWRPKLTGRAVVLLHDTNVRERGFGVWRLWTELRLQYPGFEFLHGHGLGVLAVGSACSEAVQALTGLADTPAGVIRERFALLGERWQWEMQAKLSYAEQLAELQRVDGLQHQGAVAIEGLKADLARVAAEAELARTRADREQAEAGAAQAAQVAEAARLAQAAEREAEDRARGEAAAAAAAGQALALALAEAAGLRARVGEGQSGLLALSREAALAQAAAEAARSEAALARDREAGAEAARAQAEAAISALRHEAERFRTEAAAARHEAQMARAEFQAVAGSTLWRATAPLRSGAGLLPRTVRRAARRGLRVALLTASGGLGAYMRGRREALARAQAVAASPAFDPAWYAAANPDVAASGLGPALHFAARGGPEGRDPGPGFQTQLYLQRRPEAADAPGGAFLHALAHGLERDGHPPGPSAAAAPPEPPAPVAQPADPAPGAPPTPGALFARQFPDLNPLRVFAAPHAGQRRLTVVTDSINGGSLYGGVGTAMILATLAAARMGAGLRIVTRTEPPDTGTIGPILDIHGVPWDGNIEFLFAPREGGRDVPATDADLFLTTSWWTTWSTRQSAPRNRIAYLLQEDERMFYPAGDQQLRCAETLSDAGLLHLVNSRLLLAHLQSEGLAPGGVAFEPSFPERAYHARAPAARSGKRNLFFYARPYNARNLYWRGLEALSAAIEEGVLDPAEWDFHFAGHGATPVTLPRGAEARFPGPMSWPDYAAFVRRMDVGLCLMYTPHPSYPPLDLAASGAVVVTNRFGSKRGLDQYSPNILCTEPDVAALVAGLRRAAALAEDHEARAANFARNGLQRDWAVSMAPALDRLDAWAKA